MTQLIWPVDFFLSFGPVFVFPHSAHSWVVDFQSQNRGHRKTRLCPSNIFNALLYIPCLWLLTLATYRSSSSPSLPLPLSSAASANLAPDSSSPSCSHHILATYSPGLCTVSLQRSKIDGVAMYCATVFCLFGTYAPISSNPTSSIAVSSGGYSQPPSSCRFGCLPIIRLATL